MTMRMTRADDEDENGRMTMGMTRRMTRRMTMRMTMWILLA